MPEDEPFDPEWPLWSPGYVVFKPHHLLRSVGRFNRHVHDPWSYVITGMPRSTTIRDVCATLAQKVHRDQTRWPDVVLYWNGQPLDYDALACHSFAGADNEVIRTTRGMYCLYGSIHRDMIKRDLVRHTWHWDYIVLLGHEAPHQGADYPPHPAPVVAAPPPPRVRQAWAPAWADRKAQGVQAAPADMARHSTLRPWSPRGQRQPWVQAPEVEAPPGLPWRAPRQDAQTEWQPNLRRARPVRPSTPGPAQAPPRTRNPDAAGAERITRAP